jgi:hypothetical protein
MHKQMEADTQAKIAYGAETVDKHFKEAIVSGHIWQVERAVATILEAINQGTKKLKKKSKKAGFEKLTYSDNSV